MLEHKAIGPVEPPVIQIALDYPSLDEALAMAQVGVQAGVDWLEVGTPLITCQGLAPISALAKAFPDHPILADYKTMDSGFKNVQRTAEHGGHLMSVCANAPDETVKSAIAEGKMRDIVVVVDTIGVKDQAARAKQCAQWGADIIYLHYGADQRVADDTSDSTQWIEQVQSAVSIPVGCGCFGLEDAMRAVRLGVEYIVIGHPLISGSDALEQLKDFVHQVKVAYRPRVELAK